VPYAVEAKPKRRGGDAVACQEAHSGPWVALRGGGQRTSRWLASTPVLATKRALTRATIMAAQTHGPVSALGSLSDVASGGA
jgi:hypothetical protein